MPSTSVTSAAGNSQGAASQAASPASAPKASTYRRMIEYAPTLVMIANSAATGPGALA